jgi:hypothetical protein
MKYLLLLALVGCYDEPEDTGPITKTVTAVCKLEQRNECLTGLASLCEPYEIIKEEVINSTAVTFLRYKIEAVCK